MTNADRQALIAALQWHIDAGADEALADEASDLTIAKAVVVPGRGLAEDSHKSASPRHVLQHSRPAGLLISPSGEGSHRGHGHAARRSHKTRPRRHHP